MFAIAGSFDTYGLLLELVAWQMRTFVGLSTVVVFAVSAVEAASVATSDATARARTTRREGGAWRR